MEKRKEPEKEARYEPEKFNLDANGELVSLKQFLAIHEGSPVNSPVVSNRVCLDNIDYPISDGFKFDSEEKLIAFGETILVKFHKIRVATLWILGTAVNTHYKKEYGKGTFGQVAQKWGIAPATLRSACNFAKKFTIEQLNSLFTGNFELSWRQISQNLTLKSDKLLEVYQSSADAKQFNNAVKNFKKKSENRGRIPKPSKDMEIKRLTEELKMKTMGIQKLEFENWSQRCDNFHLKNQIDCLKFEIDEMN
jgi:hypothetical protein